MTARAALPPIFVLNMARSVERRAHIAAQLTAQNVPFEVRPAIDARDLSEKTVRELLGEVPLQPQPFLGRRLTMGEIACGLSHLEIYRRMQCDHLDDAVVLEDDVDLLPSFGSVLRALAADTRFEMVLLGHHSARHGHHVGAETCLYRRIVSGEHRMARVCEFAMGAYGYFITTGAAARLARYAEPMRMPADWVTGYAHASGVLQHAITPPCVVPAQRFCAESEIGSRDDRGVTAAGGNRATRGVVRRLGGSAFLALRKLGFFPGLYNKGF